MTGITSAGLTPISTLTGDPVARVRADATGALVGIVSARDLLGVLSGDPDLDLDSV